MERIKGPRGFHVLKSIARYYRDPIDAFDHDWRVYGDVYRIKFGGYDLVHVSSPKLTDAILNKTNDFYMSSVLGTEKLLIGNGLTSNNGANWLTHRRMIQPLFHREKIQKIAVQMANDVEKWVDIWKEKLRQGKTIEIDKDLLALNHLMLGKFLFGNTPDQIIDLFEMIEFSRSFSNQRLNSLISPPLNWPLKKNKQFSLAVFQLRNFVQQKIETLRKDEAQNQQLLAGLISSHSDGYIFSDEKIIDEVMTLMFAAYEDPINIISWALLLLSKNKDVRDTLYQEISSIFSGRAMDVAQISSLPWLTATINETSRLYPPTWSLLRDVVQNSDVNGFSFHQGQIVMLDVYQMQRHPDVWANPTQFLPQRFLDSSLTPDQKKAFIPFGAGPRKCIGYAFAQLEIKIILATLLKNFQFEMRTNSLPQMDSDASLRIRGGLQEHILIRPISSL